MNQADETQRNILVVEDSDDDVFALRRALKKAAILHPIKHLTDGKQAVEYLTGQGNGGAIQAESDLPLMIFLDLKLPFYSGFELLMLIGRTPALKALPVVILSGSDEPKDRKRASELGASAYLVKPASPEGLAAVMAGLRRV